MKWFANDSDADQDPKIKALIRKFELVGELLASRYHDPNLKTLVANAGVGALWRTWCFVSRHGAAVDPAGVPLVGWSLDSRGEPYPVEDMAINAGFTIEQFEDLMAFCADRGHIDPKQWRRKIVVFPAMIKRADEYTRKLIARAQQDTAAMAPDTVGTLSGEHPPTRQDKRSHQITRPRSRARKRAADLVASPAFDRFWLAWPDKAARVAALDAWAKAGIDGRLDTDLLVDETIIPAVRRQTEELGWLEVATGGEYPPHASTWINGRRWEDASRPRRRMSEAPRGRAATGGTGAPGSAKSDAYARLASGGGS